MGHYRLLHIYDDAAGVCEPRPDADYVVAASGGVPGLLKELDSLRNSGHTFQSAVITSHGTSGQLEFDGQPFTRYDGSLRGRNYSRLFPCGGRIYINGCSVGSGDEGTRFLSYVGANLLAIAGGVVAANTRSGVSVEGVMSALLKQTSFATGELLRGHVVHIPGMKYVVFTPGGNEWSWYEDRSVFPS